MASLKFRYYTPVGIFFNEETASISNNLTRKVFRRKIINQINGFRREVVEFDYCEYCGRKYPPSSSAQKFCSRECLLVNLAGIKNYDKEAKILAITCPICTSKFSSESYKSNSPVIDHSHENGEFRGIICSDCNRALGLLKDNVENFKRGINYLIKTKEEIEKIKNMKIKICKVKDVKTPIRSTLKSAGIDFFIPNEFKKTVINPNESILIPSGIKVRIPEGYALVANNKSGIATKKKLLVGAAVVDEDYQGEVHLHLINCGTSPVEIDSGDKIIQFLLEKQEYCGIELVDNEIELFGNMESERGSGGFGSTDEKK